MPLPKQGGNSLFSNSFLIFIIRFFPSLANLLVMIWYSRRFNEHFYGLYQNFWIQVYVLAPLICFGLHIVMVTYSKETIVGIARSIPVFRYSRYSIWVLALGVVFAMMQYHFLGNDFVLPFIFLILFSLNFILESFLIVCRNYITLTVINITFSVSWCLIHWYCMQESTDLPDLFRMLFVIIAARFFIYAVIGFIHFRKTTTDNNITIAELSKIRSLWLHLGLYDVLQVLFSYIDKFIISLLLVAQVSAIYYNASQNIPFLPLLLSAAGSAVLLQLASRKSSVENADTIRLMNQSGKLLSSVVFPVFFYLLFFRYELIVKLFTEKYLPAVPIFLMSILVLPVRAYNFTTVLQRHHKGHIINAGAIADLALALVLMYPLYRWLGLPGVALSFVISTYLQAAFYLYHSAKLLHTHPLKMIPLVNWLIKLIVYSCMFIAIHYMASRYFTGWITLILGGVALVMIILASLFIELKKQKQDVGTR